MEQMMRQKQQWDWVTAKMFYDKLEELVCKMPRGELLTVPGMYEVLQE